MPKIVAYTGNEAVSEAMRQIEPDVVAAYPITPQTEVVQRFASFVNDGVVRTEMITVESEHRPLNIHCDHADSMGARDTCWIQLYSENAQEAYDNLIQAVTIAETSDVLLPVMVCVDGFIISHSIERTPQLGLQESSLTS